MNHCLQQNIWSNCIGRFSETSVVSSFTSSSHRQDRNGDSNLIYAARGGHRTVVEALMKKYADVDLVGKDRKTALYWAVEKGHTQVVKVSHLLFIVSSKFKNIVRSNAR